VLKERPANLFVATFIGEPPMNVFDARVENRDGRVFVAVPDAGGTAAFAVEPAAAGVEMLGRLGDAAALRLGVRPHNIALGRGAAKALIVSNQWLGDQTHLVLEAGGHQLVAVSYVRVAERPGATIPFSVAPDRIHLFDAQTGKALLHGREVAE
jgi:multiple sugar transport system ATP-binding protein